jgi:hypothetical protein
MLVLVTSGQWFFLQSLAWVQMTVSYAKTESLSVALEKTFSGKNPCKLCKLVKHGKAAEQKRDKEAPQLKIDFQLAAGTAVLEPPGPFRHITPYLAAAALRAQTPPLPPPRLSVLTS